ncbi:YkgJ family cysteine cluster protein [Gloeocapsa sp. PCC 73106]|uniref:YkgJ family cysteine cluster protein n=1 Tax=Gloeocapsa sp. PCC 73106 TaxID=102232 RepID=UPI0002AC95BC|nr:YkgJ family cysteine cluster protein [Gloeocapsa sp. PCC 73106]ELR99406.1 putative Fe-S oxidoreductase [Gloeocapsa sp. PCC 73106]
MISWRCVKSCGACCHLDPTERPDLADYLSPEQLREYLNLVGNDGWCVNYDHQLRECRIYSQRPRFCRVEPDIFAQMYGVDETEFNDFAIECCLEQIEGVYGNSSPEMLRYEETVKSDETSTN